MSKKCNKAMFLYHTLYENFSGFLFANTGSKLHPIESGLKNKDVLPWHLFWHSNFENQSIQSKVTKSKVQSIKERRNSVEELHDFEIAAFFPSPTR